MRQTLVKLASNADANPRPRGAWDLRLAATEAVADWKCLITPLVEGRQSRAQTYDMAHHLRQRRANFARWENSSTSFHTNNEVFDALLKTAIGDFHALQIPDGSQHIIAAGIPWFATIFGRDSIIAAYQSLASEFAARGRYAARPGTLPGPGI